MVLDNRFLEPAWRRDGAVAVTVERDVRRHVGHIAGVGGWPAVGVGSDLDGGLGREESPQEIETIADLRTIGSVVPEHARDAVLGENWLRFLRAALP